MSARATAARWALARVVETGVLLELRRALAGVDPLVRWRAERVARAAWHRAAQTTAVTDPSHVARLAALALSGREPEASYDDVAGVRAEYEALTPAAAPRRGPRVLATALGVLLLVPVVALALWRSTRPFDPSALPAGRLFGEALTEHVVALSARDPERTARARAVIEGLTAGRAERRLLGDAGSQQLLTLLAAAEGLSGTPAQAGADATVRATETYLGAAAQLSATLAAREVPFFLDADWLTSPAGIDPTLLTFYVQREARAEADGRQHRVVHLWRLDRLNLRQGYLGYTRARTPAALVLLDQIEEDLVRYVLPALPPDERLEIVDDATFDRMPPWAEALTREGAAAVRRHFAPALTEPGGRLARVGELLAARRRLIRRWRSELAGLGLRFVVPRRLVPEADYGEELRLRVPKAGLHEWDALHEELLGPELLAAFERARHDYVTSVERHEVQHRIDYGQGLRPVPEALARSLGVENPLDVAEGSLPARSRDELSAFQAQLASDPSPLLGLLLLARFGVDQGNVGGPYWYAAYHTFAGAAEALGLDPIALAGRGSISTERFSRLVLPLISREPAALREALARSYQRTWGSPVPSVSVSVVRDHAAWRH